MKDKKIAGLGKGFDIVTHYVFPIIFMGMSGFCLWQGWRWLSGYNCAVAVLMFSNKFIQEIFDKKMRKDIDRAHVIMERKMQEIVANAKE